MKIKIFIIALGFIAVTGAAPYDNGVFNPGKMSASLAPPKSSVDNKPVEMSASAAAPASSAENKPVDMSASAAAPASSVDNKPVEMSASAAAPASSAEIRAVREIKPSRHNTRATKNIADIFAVTETATSEHNTETTENKEKSTSVPESLSVTGSPCDKNDDELMSLTIEVLKEIVLPEPSSVTLNQYNYISNPSVEPFQKYGNVPVEYFFYMTRMRQLLMEVREVSALAENALKKHYMGNEEQHQMPWEKYPVPPPFQNLDVMKQSVPPRRPIYNIFGANRRSYPVNHDPMHKIFGMMEQSHPHLSMFRNPHEMVHEQSYLPLYYKIQN